MSRVHDETLLHHAEDPSMPPHALPSERCVLGAVLWHGPELARPLHRADFYHSWHGDLLEIIRGLYGRHPDLEYLDPVAVLHEVVRVGHTDQAFTIIDLYDEARARGVSVVSARYHVEQILDAAEARLRQTYGQALAAGADDGATLTQELHDRIADVRGRAGADEHRVAESRIGEIVRRARLAAATTPAATPTGLADLDAALNGGLRPATFNVLGARPGAGKSLLAGSVAAHVASTGLARVLYLTLELSATEVTNRVLAGVSGVELTRLQNPDRLDDTDHYRLDHAQEQVADWPLHIVDGSRTIGQVEDTARRFLSPAPAGLLVVDYLGRIREDGSAPSRERHVGLCSSRLTDLAHELRIPVLCVVSFSRDSARRPGPPRMDDIRDSGTVESDADTVMLMWQPEPEDAHGVELLIDKNRYGELGSVPLVRQGHRGRVVSVARWGAAA